MKSTAAYFILGLPWATMTAHAHRRCCVRWQHFFEVGYSWVFWPVIAAEVTAHVLFGRHAD